MIADGQDRQKSPESEFLFHLDKLSDILKKVLCFKKLLLKTLNELKFISIFDKSLIYLDV